MCNKTVRKVRMHQRKYITSSGAPSFPMVASIRAGTCLLRNGETKKVQTLSLISSEATNPLFPCCQAQDDIQHIVKYFLRLSRQTQYGKKPRMKVFSHVHFLMTGKLGHMSPTLCLFSHAWVMNSICSSTWYFVT
jgi:hypothetical protein